MLPAIWPETWCYALSELWMAGLPVLAFDHGAPAERIRRAARGWLVPLGTRLDMVVNRLISLAKRARANSQHLLQERRAMPRTVQGRRSNVRGEIRTSAEA